MQRRRLKKVIDPMQSIMALQSVGYTDYLNRRVSEHGQKSRDQAVFMYNLPWLFAACVPLSYFTKSLLIPATFLCFSLYGLLYTDLLNKDCYYCRPSLRSLPSVSHPELTIDELNRRRSMIFNRINESNKIESLGDISKALDKEI